MIFSQPSCPYGSYMNEDGNCISVDKVPAERTCPAGYQPYEKGCLRRDLIQAIPFCPSRAFQLFQHGSESECVKLTEEEPLFTCKEGVFDSSLGLCIKHSEEEPTVSCPPGFELNETAHQCERRLFVDPVPFCEEGWDLSPDPETGLLTCVSFWSPPPARVCPEADYHLVGDSCVLEKLADPQPVCPQEFVYNRWDDMCRRVRAHAATPVCREGWKFIKETGKCTLEEEPTYLCPDGDMDGHLRPQLEAGKQVERPQHLWPEKSERSEEEDSVTGIFASGAAARGRLWDAAVRALQETPFFDRRSKGPGSPQAGAEAPRVADPAKAAQCATVETQPPQMGCEHGELISLLALEEGRLDISTDHDASRQDDESPRVHSFPSPLSLEVRDSLFHVLNEERRFSQAPERDQGQTRKPHVTPTDVPADEDLSAVFASSSFPSPPPDVLSSVEEPIPSSTSPSRLKMLNLRRPLSALGRSAGAQALDDEREDREKRERKAKREDTGEVLAPPEGGTLAADEGQAVDRRGEAKPSENGKKRAPPGASGDLSLRRGGRPGDGSDTGEADRRLLATGPPGTKDPSNNGRREKARETQEQRAPSTTRLDSHLASHLPTAGRGEKHPQKDLKDSENRAAPSPNGSAPFRATATASSGGSAKTAALTQRASLGLHRLPRLPSPRSRRLEASSKPPHTATSTSPNAKARLANEEPATSSTSSTFFAQETSAGLVCRQRIVVAPTLVPGPCSQKGGASPRGWAKADVSEKECVEVRTKKPTLICPSGRVADDAFVTPRCEQVGSSCRDAFSPRTKHLILRATESAASLAGKLRVTTGSEVPCVEHDRCGETSIS
ncbi:putative oocyst wall protein [Toxoplasma gondii GAB2-2007-GAL-DOM2]|uniref:Putative oocyst wall protein n=3 Tax=Toxoplasma gondii TaxID=5811 RepID=A0A086LDA8_TOXGO|nr:putative oocyst wall protein [Toxoplasma gondii GAB2-2007-GAL-DOM2]KFG54626.1 putative oocyst wall protein [Toxoplasma gondii FOU]RQX75032.1 putative oocyst wall protein [Toxoplasma gondii CAST]